MADFIFEDGNGNEEVVKTNGVVETDASVTPGNNQASGSEFIFGDGSSVSRANGTQELNTHRREREDNLGFFGKKRDNDGIPFNDFFMNLIPSVKGFVRDLQKPDSFTGGLVSDFGLDLSEEDQMKVVFYDDGGGLRGWNEDSALNSADGTDASQGYFIDENGTFKLEDDGVNNIFRLEGGEVRTDVNKVYIDVEDNLEEELNTAVINRDLDIGENRNMFYNKERSTQFINKHYGTNQQLINAGINPEDFEGWLIRTGFVEGYNEREGKGTYESTSVLGKDFFDAETTRQRELRDKFDEYLFENKVDLGYDNDKIEYIKNNPDVLITEKIFVPGGNRNIMEENAARGERVKYKMTVEQALEQGDDWWAEKIGLRDYNKIAQNEEQLYTQGDILQNFDLANKESEALAKKQKEQQAEADRIFMEPGATGDKVLENFEQVVVDGGVQDLAGEKLIEDTLMMGTIRTLNEIIGITGYRPFDDGLYKWQTNINNREDFESQRRAVISGKSLEIDGVLYTLTKDGGIYNNTSGYDLSNDGSEKYKKIEEKLINEGEFDRIWDKTATTKQAAVVLGDIVFQVFGGGVVAKGLRTAGSARFIAAANRQGGAINRIRKRLGYKGPINTRVRNKKTGRFDTTKDTFGVKLPFSKGMADAISFQTLYGANMGYSNTYAAAVEAGLSSDESSELAKEGMYMMGALYAFTAPLAPRIGQMEKLAARIKNTGAFNKAVQQSLKRGPGAFSSSLQGATRREIASTIGKSILLEGGKEAFQENVQQLGEVQINQQLQGSTAANLNLMTEYSKDDFILTTGLSFAMGGLMGGKYDLMSNNKKPWRNLHQLSKNRSATQKRLNQLVKSKSITKADADAVMKDVDAWRNNINKVPAWMFKNQNSQNYLLDVVLANQKINDLKNGQKSGVPGNETLTKKQIDEEVAKQEEILNKAKMSAAGFVITDNITAVKKFVQEGDMVVFESVKEMENAINPVTGEKFTAADFNSDGFLERDGKIYINKEQAAKTQAVSVASHEFLHVLLDKIENQMGKEKFADVTQQFKNILKDIDTNLVNDFGVMSAYDLIQQRLVKNYGNNYSQQEWMTHFSDMIAKGEIVFEDLKESGWVKVGRAIASIINSSLGTNFKFKNGQEVFDFIKNYNAALEATAVKEKYRAEQTEAKKASISQKALETVKKQLGALSVNEAKTSPIVGEAIPGMALVQVNNRFQLDPETAQDLASDATLRTLERLNSKPWDGTGTLYGWINFNISKSILDALRADGNSATPLYLNKIDPDSLSRLENTLTTQEEGYTEKETKTYTPLVKSRIFPNTTFKQALDSLLTNLRVNKVNFKMPVSLNVKEIPFIKKLRNSLGKSLLYDNIIKRMGGMANNRLKNFLLKNKTAIVENMTTTFLMGSDGKGGIPQAIEKQVDGQFVAYPAWVGQKIDRETTDTDNAGRTSGNQIVRRVPVSDEAFLSNFFTADGKLIRGRKEAIAKAMAEEYGLEVFKEELSSDIDNDIKAAFNNNQEALGNIQNSIAVNEVLDKLDRGGVKRSVSKAALKDISYNHMSFGMDSQQYKNALAEANADTQAFYQTEIFPILAGQGGFANPIKKLLDNDSIPSNIKPYVYTWSNTKANSYESKKNYYDFSMDLLDSMDGAVIKKLGKPMFGLFNGFLDPSPRLLKTDPKVYKLAQALKAKYEEKVSNFESIEASMESAQPIQSGSGIALRIQKIAAQDITREEKIQLLVAEIDAELANVKGANTQAFLYVFKKGLETAAANPKRIPGMLAWLQSNGSIGKALRALTGISDVQLLDGPQALYMNKEGSEFYLSLSDATITKTKTRTGITGQQRYDSGDIVVNTKHPLYLDAVDYLKQIGKWTADTQQNDNLLVGKNGVLTNKGEHSQPSSNTMFDANTIGMEYLSAVLEGNNTDRAKETAWPIAELKLQKLLAGFNQQLSITLLPDLQDSALGRTSRGNDARILAVGENMASTLWSTSIADTQAFGRAISYIDSVVDSVDVKRSVSNANGQQAINNARDINYTKNQKGISVYDFDDTLAFSKSKIIVTMPDGSVKQITPAEFAAQDEILSGQGAKFNFEQFNQVVEGTPGPLVPRLRKAIDKFGNKNIFVLTARPQASARAIYKFLKGLGVEIPLENIVGLENGTPAAKAGWMINKVAEGYNDFYFVDDAMKNVKAVSDVLDVFDVNGKVQQARVKRSVSMNEELNNMIERDKGISAKARYSKVVAERKGRSIGKYRFFLPSSAEDFRGLTSYTFAGKGKQGEADQKFFEDNIIEPYLKGVAATEQYAQRLKTDFSALIKKFGGKNFKRKLRSKIPNSEFTYDEAIRVSLWTKMNIDLTDFGLSKRDIKFLNDVVNKDPQLMAFGSALTAISRVDGWVKPDAYWNAGNLVSDLHQLSRSKRKEFIKEFSDNVDVMFDEATLNKIEALYGTRHRQALQDSIRRMKSGSNKPSGGNRILKEWNDWITNSIGTIMFFNRRSAITQLLSTFNFINWSDNNPLNAALAFANQAQFWKDFTMIFNSDKLKQRRGGLKSDIQEQEIASAAANSTNKGKAVISYLLKIGFTPTQIADSLAIAMGGASMYRNRVKTYMKEGMSQSAAEAKAFQDFSKLSDEAQQSGDPMLISQQQAGYLGRLVLAFQNTPMQYTRLMKKAGQDILNGRGDLKTNLSKIVYYGAVQNFIFAALQNALFAIVPGFDDDDNEEDEAKFNKKKGPRIVNTMMDSILRGSGLAGAVVSTIKNAIQKYFEQEDKGFTADHTYTIIELMNISPPIGSKLRKLYSAIQTRKFDKDVIEAHPWDIVIQDEFNISPTYNIIGNVVSALFNLPLDRALMEITSIAEAFDTRNTIYQRIALALGWRTWGLNVQQHEFDLIKRVAKEKRKREGIEKRKQTLKNKKKKNTTEFIFE